MSGNIYRLAKQYGFQFHRQGKGSHQIWQHPNGQTILVSPNKSANNWKRFEAELRRKTS